MKSIIENQPKIFIFLRQTGIKCKLKKNYIETAFGSKFTTWVGVECFAGRYNNKIYVWEIGKHRLFILDKESELKEWFDRI